MSVRNGHYSPHNNPEDRGSQLHHGGSLKSHIHMLVAFYFYSLRPRNVSFGRVASTSDET
jgi:hypothetical protein